MRRLAELSGGEHEQHFAGTRPARLFNRPTWEI
jgi:hypothetical protein